MFAKLCVFSQAVIILLDHSANLPSKYTTAGMISWEFKGALWPTHFISNCVLECFKRSSYLLINLHGVGAQEMQCLSNMRLTQSLVVIGGVAGSGVSHRVSVLGCSNILKGYSSVQVVSYEGCSHTAWVKESLLGKFCLADGNCEYRELGKCFQFQKE